MLNENEKQFHIWFSHCLTGEINCNTPFDIELALNEGLTQIHTYQVESVGTYLFDIGYRIFVHPHKGSVFELTLGKCSNINTEIKVTHNLCKLLMNNAFDTEETKVTGLD